MHKSLEALIGPERTAWYTNALRVHVEIFQQFLDSHEPGGRWQVAVVRADEDRPSVPPLTDKEIATLREMISIRPTFPFVS